MQVTSPRLFDLKAGCQSERDSTGPTEGPDPVWGDCQWGILQSCDRSKSLHRAHTHVYPVVAVRTYFIAPFLFKDLLITPFSWVIGTVLIVATFCIPLAVKQEKYLHAFLASSVTMACMILITGLGLFPLLVPSSIDPAYSLTLYNASAGPSTLTAMLVIALISLPLVISYTVYIHRVFRGKVIISEESHY